MNEEGKGRYYRCRQCKNKTLYVEDRGNEVVGECKTCGYSFTKPKNQKPLAAVFLNSLNKFSGIIGIVALIGLILLFGAMGEQNTIIQNDVNALGEQQDNNYDFLNGTLNALKEKTNNLKNDVDNALAKVLVLEGDASTLYGNLGIIKDNLTSIDENITDIWNAIYTTPAYSIVSHIDCNLTKTYFNHTTDTRYCHFNLTVDSNINVNEVKFSTKYAKTNISLLNNTGHVQEYQYTNGNHTDNYMISWFGLEDHFKASFNLSWHISDYNTSNLSNTGFDNLLVINGEKIPLPDVWEVKIE